jgi:hypothetical protein
MLEFKDSSGYVFYLNHLISCLILGPALFWTCWLLNKKSDKFLHVAVSAVLSVAFIWLLPKFGAQWWIASIMVFAIGVAKEIIDYLNPKKRKFDLMDLFADLVGNGAVSLVYLFSFVMHDPKM